MNILLALILLVNVIILCGFAYAFVKIRGVFREFKEFITPPAENQPSKLALVCESLSEMIGRSLVASLKGFLMGAKSAEVRGANAEVGAGIDASPIGAIVGMLPKSVRANLIKNPQLIDMAIGFMQKRSGQTAPASDNNHSNTQVKFKL
jgi:uncharacterized protein YneF (UPF0154 family)